MTTSARELTCGKSCYTAKRAKCTCWCQGYFHGKAGAEARKLVMQATGGILPRYEWQWRKLLTTVAKVIAESPKPRLLGS